MIILAPVKTEKAIQGIGPNNEIFFKVTLDSNKKEIKREFERIFEVKVKTIRTYSNPKGEKLAIIKLTKEYKADDVSTKLKLIA